MIIVADKKLPIGKIICGQIYDHQGIKHIVTFQVIRKATREEYLNYCKEYNSPLEPKPDGFYFKISMD